MLAIAVAVSPRSHASPPVLALSSVSPGESRLIGGNIIADTALDPSGGIVATSASYTLKLGFAGQLYDVAALDASAQPPVVNEGGTSQLRALAIMDDETTLPLAAEDVTWSIISGPFNSIDLEGLVTAGPVVGERAAVARGGAFGLTSEILVSILDSDRDNYAPVSGDGIDDAWQFAFFDTDHSGGLEGAEAAEAGPSANPDHDLHNNFFEWASGHDPKNPSSFLRFQILSKTGTTARFGISKSNTGTTYAVMKSTTLGPGALSSDVFSFTATIDEVNVELSDATAISPSGFYRLRLERAP